MIISKSTIDKVFETARVEEVIGDFVTLKKAGSNYKALSPFSDEKTPSFMVSPAKQIWKDFSTGKGGNSVSFLMEHEHYSYPETIIYLAKKYNIEIERIQQTNEQKQADNHREGLYLVLEFAQKYYSESLWKNEKGKAIGLSYFRERGFTDETIKTFKLGYNIDEWSIFTNTALQKGFQLEFLEETGLTIVKDKNKFDRFKGRVLFPIQSISGRVLGFGGRILKKNKNASKYLNSPESDIYHKSKILYGLYQSKQSIIKQDVCYLVEGYTDVISLYQRDVKNVVASLGTALTREQVNLIKRFTSNITILFDGDTAGVNAAMRGIDLVLEQGMNVKVVMFPNGQDPDSFAKSVNKEDLATYLKEKSEDFIIFKTSLLMEQIKINPIKKGALIRDIVGSIAKIPSDIQKEIYIQFCSKLLKISENVLFKELAQIVQINLEQLRKSQRNLLQKKQRTTQILKENPIENTENNSLEFCEREILKILLLYPNEEFIFEDWKRKQENNTEEFVKEQYKTNSTEEIFLQLQQDEITFSNSVFQKIYDIIIESFKYQKDIDYKELSNHKDPDIAKIVTDILMEDEKYHLNKWNEKGMFTPSAKQQLQRWVSDSILNLRRLLVERIIKISHKNLANNDNNMNEKERIIEYTKLKISLFKSLGERIL